MTIIRVIDFETTGAQPPEAEVCEVGICDLHLEERRIDPPRSWLCGVKAMPPEVRAVHHISAAECAGLPPYDQAALFEGADITAIAAHNLEFEAKFIAVERWAICTYKSALRVWPNAPAHNNGTIRYWLEDQGKIAPQHELTQPAHRAGPDAYTTAHILMALFDAGASGREMIAWTKEPKLLPTCPIGEHRGKPWSEVDLGFLDWMIRKGSMDEDLKWNARREIACRQSTTP